MSLVEIFQQEWAIRALAASTMVGITCGVLGCFIVLRNMALIGDALSHAILPGVFVAFIFFGYNVLGFFFGSVAAGLLAALGITWLQQNVKTKNDAAIGIVFTAMFSLGVMGISWISKSEGVHLDLKDFLFGNILGVSNQDLGLTAFTTLYVLGSVIAFYRYLFVSTFQPVIAETMGISVKVIHYFLMLLLSFVVVASLQTVGVILVVAMLVTPAATALLLTDRLHWVLVVAAVSGMLAAVTGLILAIVLNTTPGPAMAIVATLFYLAAALFSPKKGLIFKALRKKKLQSRIKREDVLKQSYRLQQKEQLTFEALRSVLGFHKSSLINTLTQLQKEQLFDKKIFRLTEQGMEAANRLVRAHRLWETYLVQKIGLTDEQIHEEAEKYEHLLPDEILDEVDEQLGYPTTDPHGSPIPSRPGSVEFSLHQLQTGQSSKIALQQSTEQIAARLWQLGLSSGADLVVEARSEEQITVRQRDRTIEIPIDLARKIRVEHPLPLHSEQ